VVLTISGSIKAHNRGALDPAFDQLFAKHQVKFADAFGVDLSLLASMKTVTIRPTLEYDSRQHTLSGPLLTDVLDHVGAPGSAQTQILMHAVDGYAVMTSLDKLRAYRFIVAAQMGYLRRGHHPGAGEQAAQGPLRIVPVGSIPFAGGRGMISALRRAPLR
jgi:hypothetical protein